MKINKSTQLWEDLTLEEESEMELYGESIIIGNNPPVLHKDFWPSWLKLWMNECGYTEDRHHLAVISTVVPGRIFLSILKNRKENAPTAPSLNIL